MLRANLEAAVAGRAVVEAQLKNARLVAPFAGTVMKLDLVPGAYVAPGAPVLLLADASAWQVETTDLTELNVAEVSLDALVTVTRRASSTWS